MFNAYIKKNNQKQSIPGAYVGDEMEDGCAINLHPESVKAKTTTKKSRNTYRDLSDFTLEVT